MTTLQATHHPDGRRRAGDTILAAAKALSTTAVSKPLKAFATAHKAYSSADDRVARADAIVRKQQAAIGERDAEQDGAVDALSRALIAAGFPKGNPFKPLGFAPPSEVIRMGYADEAKLVLKLAAAAKKSSKLDKETAALTKAANAVTAAIAPLTKLLAARKAAIAERDALEQAWETAFAGLKLAAQYSDHTGNSKGLFAALFVRTAPPKRPRKAAAPPPPAPVG